MNKQELLDRLEKLIYDLDDPDKQRELAQVFNYIDENLKDWKEANDYILNNMHTFSNDIRPILFKVVK